MTKVALLLWGQPRFLNNLSSHESHVKHIMLKYETDVFVHAWWSREPEDMIPSSWSQMTNPVPYNRDTIKYIRTLYNPVHAVYEKQIEFENNMDKAKGYDFIKSPNDLNNMKSHLYSMKKVGEVLRDYKDPNEYDFIVLSRFDNIIEELGEFHNLGVGFYRMQDHPGLADQLFVFSPKFLKFLDVFDEFDELGEDSSYSLERMKEKYFAKYFPDHGMNPLLINLRLARS